MTGCRAKRRIRSLMPDEKSKTASKFSRNSIASLLCHWAMSVFVLFTQTHTHRGEMERKVQCTFEPLQNHTQNLIVVIINYTHCGALYSTLFTVRRLLELEMHCANAHTHQVHCRCLCVRCTARTQWIDQKSNKHLSDTENRFTSQRPHSDILAVRATKAAPTNNNIFIIFLDTFDLFIFSLVVALNPFFYFIFSLSPSHTLSLSIALSPIQSFLVRFLCFFFLFIVLFRCRTIRSLNCSVFLICFILLCSFLFLYFFIYLWHCIRVKWNEFSQQDGTTYFHQKNKLHQKLFQRHER